MNAITIRQGKQNLPSLIDQVVHDVEPTIL